MAYSATITDVSKNTAGFTVTAELLSDGEKVASVAVQVPDGTGATAAKNLVKAALQNERTLYERTPPVSVGDSITVP